MSDPDGPPVRVDKLAGPAAQRLLAAMLAAFAEAGVPVCRGYLAAGSAAPPMDGCDCRCTVTIPADGGPVDVDGQGEAWVRVTQIAPRVAPAARTTTRASSRTSGCGHRRWTLTVQLGVSRCAAAMPDETAVVDPAARTADALLLADAAALRRMLAEHFPGVAAGTWTPMGVSGGCFGGAMTATLDLPECRCG